LEARHDDLYERYNAVCQALTDLVDALVAVPDAWTPPEHAHLQLMLRQALAALAAAQEPYTGGLYG
jgi:hypothetical protein